MGPAAWFGQQDFWGLLGQDLCTLHLFAQSEVTLSEVEQMGSDLASLGKGSGCPCAGHSL